MSAKPVKVIRRGGRHPTEVRVFAREIRETFCAKRGCEFFGKHAQQGECHTRERFDGGLDWRYIDSVQEYAVAAMKQARRMYRPGGVNNRKRDPRAYVEYLEAQAVCHWMQGTFDIDQLIRLRRRVALLEVRRGTRRPARRAPPEETP